MGGAGRRGVTGGRRGGTGAGGEERRGGDKTEIEGELSGELSISCISH